jgi:tripartite motif-containing protein 28
MYVSCSNECQINAHKNHQYLFVDEAIDNQKSQLHSLVNRVRDVRLMMNKIQHSRHQQLADIDQIERRTTDDIKLFGLNLIAQISRTCKLLIHDANILCNEARNQLNDK